jgi:hypothetical protein
MNIEQFIVRRELMHKLELEPRELSNIDDNLLRRLLKNVQGTCINYDNGYVYRINEILKKSDGKRRNEDLTGAWQYTVLYSADTIMLRKGEPLYGLRVDVVDKLGVHCSYNDMIIMFIDAEYLDHNYTDTIRKGSIIDVVILQYNYIPNSKRINCLGSEIQYYTVHPTVTNSYTLIPTDHIERVDVQELYSVPTTIDPVYYRLTDPFWTLSSKGNMDLLIKDAMGQLPLKRYAKVNAKVNANVYPINGLELSETVDRTLNVYTELPESIDTKNDNLFILTVSTVVANRDRINEFCSSGNSTVYTPYVKMGQWDVTNVLSKSYLIILVCGIYDDGVSVDGVSSGIDIINSVVNGYIKRINTQLYAVKLLSERYNNVSDSPEFKAYFTCQEGITNDLSEQLDSVK